MTMIPGTNPGPNQWLKHAIETRRPGERIVCAHPRCNSTAAAGQPAKPGYAPWCNYHLGGSRLDDRSSGTCNYHLGGSRLDDRSSGTEGAVLV